MSTYRRDKTQIKDEALFNQALSQVCQERKLRVEHDPAGQLRLRYGGGMAHYRISHDQVKGMDDLAWRKEQDGSFTLLHSAHTGYGNAAEVAVDVQARYSELWLDQNISRHPRLRRMRKKVKRNARNQVVSIRLEA